MYFYSNDSLNLKLDEVCRQSDFLLGTPSNDFEKIKFFFSRIYHYDQVLVEFERRFNRFLVTYQITISSRNIFKKWATLNKKIPYFIPAIDQFELDDIKLAENLRPLHEQQNIFLLFLFSQLLDLKILSDEKTLDEQLVYLSDLVDGKVINQYMLDKKVLYVDSGYSNNITHGKYIHLIQYVLLGIALREGLLTIPTLVNSIDKPGWFHEQLLHHLFKQNIKSVLAYDYCFENFGEDKIAGAPGLNLFLLTDLFSRSCPIFAGFFRFNYLKNMAKNWRQYRAYGVDFKEYLSFSIDNIGGFEKMDDDSWIKWHESYIDPDANYISTDGLLHKSRRGDKFIGLEARIRKDYGYEKLKISHRR